MSDFSDAHPGIRWYVVHTYSGYENKVKANLEKIIENRALQHLIMDIKVPTEILSQRDEKDGSMKEVENKIFPSYVLIKMVMTDESWHVVRNVRGVTGFVGPGSKPVPLSDEEVDAIGIDTGIITLEYGVGDSVKIVAGALTGFIGTVLEISDDNKKIKILATMFGRETPVELESGDVKIVQF